MARPNSTRKTKTRSARKPPSPQSRTLSGPTEQVVGQLVDEGDKAAVLGVVRRLELEIKKLQLDLAKAKEGSGVIARASPATSSRSCSTS